MFFCDRPERGELNLNMGSMKTISSRKSRIFFYLNVQNFWLRLYWVWPRVPENSDACLPHCLSNLHKTLCTHTNHLNNDVCQWFPSLFRCKIAIFKFSIGLNIIAPRKNLFPTWTAALYFYLLACRLPVKSRLVCWHLEWWLQMSAPHSSSFIGNPFHKYGWISLNNGPIWKILNLAYSGQQCRQCQGLVCQHYLPWITHGAGSSLLIGQIR